MEWTKKVAVIGAGTSGLMAIKSLKEENFEPVCFEKTSRVGGLWHYHEDDIDGIPSCMWCTSLNNSKEPGAISDFRPKSDYPNYMRHFKVLEMFMDYAKTFDLLHHIRYNKEVIQVVKTQDYNKTGEWKVVVKDNITGHHSEDVYSGVLVCTGHLSIPNVPHFPGMESFKRKIIHSHSIKKFLDFNDKTVCVIGTGSSALDSAVEISHVAKQVYMSVRTPTWIMTRHGPYGYPLDWSILKWSFAVLQNYFPRSICNKVIQEIFIDPRFSHDLYNILPKHGPLDRDFALSDALPSRLMNGAIILKKNVNYFTEDGIVFCEEGNTVTSVDIVVLATGYLWEFPFLDSEDLIIQDKIVHLYKCVYPPHLKHPTLGIIGFIVPMGPGFPCVEMQCRWFAHVMSGKSKLPSQREMLEDIYRQYKGNLKRYGKNSRVSVHIDILPYLEDLASKIGAKPNLFKLFFTDPKLYMACVFGVFLPYRFRLVGPHKWKGAREAILTADERMRAALQGRRAFDDKYRTNSLQRVTILGVLVLAWYLWKNNLIPFTFLDVLTQLLASFYTKALQFSNAEFVILKRFLENKIVTKSFRALKEYNG